MRLARHVEDRQVQIVARELLEREAHRGRHLAALWSALSRRHVVVMVVLPELSRPTTRMRTSCRASRADDMRTWTSGGGHGG